jgi:hypothetical protein
MSENNTAVAICVHILVQIFRTIDAKQTDMSPTEYSPKNPFEYIGYVNLTRGFQTKAINIFSAIRNVSLPFAL